MIIILKAVANDVKCSITGGFDSDDYVEAKINNTTITEHKAGAKVWFSPTDAKDIENLPIISPTPTLTFTPKNFKKARESKNISFNYDYSIETPYPPENILAKRENNIITISWDACVHLAGANYRNIDNIVAGEDEGKTEGQWLIEWEGGSTTVDKPIFSTEDASVHTYAITSILNGYLSLTRKITI